MIQDGQSLPLLKVDDLVVEYPTKDGNVRAIDHVSFELLNGEVLGIVGESGCGKSTLGFSLLGLLKGGIIRKGEILFDGRDLRKMTEEEMQKIRGSKISMIFQASQNALNPLLKVENHFIDTLKEHNRYNDDSWDDVIALLSRLEISKSRLVDYPFLFSGGMQQRIVIALALLLHPKLIIADEPTTALDVLVQARTLKLFKELIDDFNLTVILITHDLGIVAEITQRVGIMYAGQLLEIGDTFTIFERPSHPYTQALIAAIPNVKDETKKTMVHIPGLPPDLRNVPEGCRFSDRCQYAIDICKKVNPEFIKLPSNKKIEHIVRCFKYDDKYKTQFQ